MGLHRITHKITHAAKKAVKYVGRNPWVLTGIGAGIQAGVEGWNVVKKNWSDIRVPLAYAGAGALLASGIGAGLGAAGLTGLTVAGSAAAGAAAGGVAGGTTGVAANEAQKAAERAAKEQERIAAQEAEAQRKLALQKAGAIPDAITDLNIEAKRRMRSQYQRNLASRNNSNKSLGGSSSTLA